MTFSLAAGTKISHFLLINKDLFCISNYPTNHIDLKKHTSTDLILNMGDEDGGGGGGW